MHIIDNIALININETLFIQLISFLIFLFIINRIMFKPLNKVMSDRDNYISGLKDSVIDAKKEMEKLVTQLNERELNAKNEAFILKKELEDSGSSKASKIFDETRKELSIEKEKADNEVAKQILEAKKHFSKESEHIATFVMEKVLNRRLTP